jgi:hypothetical protein
MKNRTLWWSVCIAAVLVSAAVTGVLAQPPGPTRFSGIFNDYTPATGVGGPWEMHGTWSLKLKGDSGKADFSADMTMEHPDSWIAANPGASTAPNVDHPAMRMPHTHHITMPDAMISYDTSVCQPDNPATIIRLVVIGQPASLHQRGSAGRVFELEHVVHAHESCRGEAFRKPGYPRHRSQSDGRRLARR